MIEFRWLEKRPGGADFFGNGYPPLRVLQYREWSEGCHPGLVEPEWKDVPVVHEWGNNAG